MTKNATHEKAHPTLVDGVIESFNASPEGQPEGALVRTGKGLVQVNFPKHSGGEVPAGFAVGRQVSARATLETDEYEHRVYKLCDEGELELHGRIARLNYARHGELNGFHLDDNTFVHLKPDGAAKVAPVVGEQVRVRGTRKPVKGPLVVLEKAQVERVGGARRKGLPAATA